MSLQKATPIKVQLADICTAHGFDIGMEKWNGFESPFFTKDQAISILDAVVTANIVGSEDDPDFRFWYGYNADTDTFTTEDLEDEAFKYSFEGQDFELEDGSVVHLYGIGAGYWVWELAD